MKGLILAAGRGSRLLPLSASRPKHTLPVAGVPIIARVVGAMREAGVHDIALVAGPAGEAQLREATRESGPLTFIQQPTPLGTGNAVTLARPFLEEQPTLLLMGDNLFENSLSSVVERLDGADAAVGVKRVPNPKAFGVAMAEDGRLTELVEKPSHPRSDLAVCGVFAFRPPLLDLVAELQASERGELEFPQAISSLLDTGGRVHAVAFDGFWCDAGTPADLLRANAHFLGTLTPRVEGRVVESQLSGLVVVEPGAQVEYSQIEGPVWIGPGAVVQGSRIGPNVSLGAGTRVQGATVREALIDEDCRITAPTRPLERALLGRHSLIAAPTEAGLQVAMGDRSVARL